MSRRTVSERQIKFRQALGPRFATAIAESGLTKKELTAITGMKNQEVITKWVEGEGEPDLYHFLLAFLALDKPFSFYIQDLEYILESDGDSGNEHQRSYGIISQLDAVMEQALDDEDKFLKQCIKIMAEGARFAVVAIFKHDWTSDILVKIHTYCHPSIDSTLLDFQELYYPGRLKFITERAWANEELFITDYGFIERNHRSQVNYTSLNLHREALGGVASTGYAFLGWPDNGYLLRFFNRIDIPSVRIDKSQFDLFTEYCDYVSKRMFSLKTEARLTEQARFFASSKNIDKPEYSLKRISSLIAREGVKSHAIIWQSKHPDHKTLNFDKVITNGIYPSEFDSLLKSQAFFNRVNAASEPFIVSGDDLVDIDAKMNLLVDEDDTHGMLVFPFQHQSRNGSNVESSQLDFNGALTIFKNPNQDETPFTIDNLRKAIPNTLTVLNTFAQAAEATLASNKQLKSAKTD